MRRVISVILDGLRKDFVNQTYMPRLADFRAHAESIDGYRSIAPSVTRVCSSTFTTGCTPANHGIEGNSLALVSGGRFEVLDTGKPDFLARKHEISGSRLERKGLAELVKDHGGSIVYSNVSPGAAYAHDPLGHGIVQHRAGSFERGQPMDDEMQIRVDGSLEGDRLMTERFIADALSDQRPALALLWLGHPDATQHEEPLGSPAHLSALHECDRLAGEVIDRVVELRAQGDDVLLIIGSDHGHQTVKEVVDVRARLSALGFSDALDAEDIVVVPNGTAFLVYATEAGRKSIASLSDVLEAEPWVGQVFRAEQLESIGQSSGRGLSLFVSMASDEELNDFGIPGRSYAAKPLFDKPDRLGCGQHGGLGRFEQEPILMIQGTGFSAGESTSTQASLVDIAPTILRHLNLAIENTDGSPLQRQ